jgi:alkanesulfonate monooxygenase SsuD/methylene tetrahydromethanopterin reductase-like flavin-dependent oxidoreductase (luciferase family)
MLMRLGVVLSPADEWRAVVEAARLADDLGLDSIGFWDHYHSPRPEWGYVCGWSAYGYLAAVTKRIRLVPNVLNSLHYELGVLAKESSMLAIATGGRFELGIGAGDWPESFAAWGHDFPTPTDRLRRMAETVGALREIWGGEAVTMRGTSIRLDGAICTPPPPAPPRVVVGVGASPRTLRHAVRFADEVNLYADPMMLDTARTLLAESGRDVDLSIVLGWEMDKWPADVAGGIGTWVERGVERLMVNVGGPDMLDRIRQMGAVRAMLS